jgi:hypothetical protein
VLLKVRPGETLEWRAPPRGDDGEYPLPDRFGRVKVAVHGRSGAPIPDMTVRVWRQGWAAHWQARTLEDGRCWIDTAPGDLTLSVGDHHVPVHVVGGESTTVELRPPPNLGEVQTLFREPRPTLARAGENVATGAARSSIEGGWLFAYLAAGEYRVLSEDGRFLGDVTVVPGTCTRFAIGLSGGGIELTFELDTRIPVLTRMHAANEAFVRLSGLESGTDFFETKSRPLRPIRSDADRIVFRATHLRPGRYAALAMIPQHGYSRLTIVVRDDEVARKVNRLGSRAGR